MSFKERIISGIKMVFKGIAIMLMFVIASYYTMASAMIISNMFTDDVLIQGLCMLVAEIVAILFAVGFSVSGVDK